MNIKIVGIDLAKDTFQLCALDAHQNVLLNRAVSRKKLAPTLAQLPPSLVAMEACSSAHHWGRVFARMGHTVRLLPPQHVKAFSRVHKSDAHDALAIAEAASRPNLHPVPVKSLDQQDLQLLNRHRQRRIDQRTAIANQIRSIAREYGVFFPLRLTSLRQQLPLALEDAENGFYIDVTDTGKAMNAQVANDLFKKHIASHNGLGVGLYHAAQDCKQAGYGLSLASNVNGAVRFRVLLKTASQAVDYVELTN